MNILRKKHNSLVFISQVDGKIQKKKIAIRRFFCEWERRIAKKDKIFDFCFLDEGILHIKYAVVSELDEYEEFDGTFKLDESILNDEIIMQKLHQLVRDFVPIAKEARETYLEAQHDAQLKEKSFQFIWDYFLDRKLPYKEDSEDYWEMVDWIKNNKARIIYSSLGITDILEKLTFRVFAYSGGAFGVVGLTSTVFNPQMFVFLGQSLPCLIFMLFMFILAEKFNSVFKENYYLSCLDLLNEYDLECRDRLNRELAMDAIAKEILLHGFIDMDLFYFANGSRELFTIEERLQSLKKRKCETLKNRFDIMGELLDIESILYSNNEKEVLKGELFDFCRGDILKERLQFLGFDNESVERVSFFRDLKMTISKLQSCPFNGVESEIINLVKIGVEYAKNLVRYENVADFIISQEYSDLLTRKMHAYMSAVKKQEDAYRLTELIKIRKRIVEAIGLSDERELTTGRSIQLEPVKDAIK